MKRFDLTQAQGSDRNAWQWGNLHTAAFSSVTISNIGAGFVEEQFIVGPVPVGGTGDTLNTTRSLGSGRNRTRVLSAPAARLIIEQGLGKAQNSIHSR